MNIGDRVEIIKEPFYLGVRGVSYLKQKYPNDRSLIVVYDMLHLIGEKGIITGYTPNFLKPDDKNLGFYHIDFDNPVDIPKGLVSEGFDKKYLKILICGS